MRRLLWALALVAGAAFGQVPAAPDSARADTARVRFPAPRKSPGTAVLLSLVLPGGGQVYTGRYWKAAIIAPVEVGLAGLSVNDHLSATRALAAGDTTGYTRLRDRRNAFLWWTGAVLAFSMADAYVSAQMYAFDRQMQFALGPARAGLAIGI